MWIKDVVFYVGCVLAWFILLPVFVIGGGIALFTYAAFTEVGSSFVGRRKKTVDSSTAREIASRMCLGH